MTSWGKNQTKPSWVAPKKHEASWIAPKGDSLGSYSEGAVGRSRRMLWDNKGEPLVEQSEGGTRRQPVGAVKYGAKDSLQSFVTKPRGGTSVRFSKPKTKKVGLIKIKSVEVSEPDHELFGTRPPVVTPTHASKDTTKKSPSYSPTPKVSTNKVAPKVTVIPPSDTPSPKKIDHNEDATTPKPGTASKPQIAPKPKTAPKPISAPTPQTAPKPQTSPKSQTAPKQQLVPKPQTAPKTENAPIKKKHCLETFMSQSNVSTQPRTYIGKPAVKRTNDSDKPKVVKKKAKGFLKITVLEPSEPDPDLFGWDKEADTEVFHDPTPKNRRITQESPTKDVVHETEAEPHQDKSISVASPDSLDAGSDFKSHSLPQSTPPSTESEISEVTGEKAGTKLPAKNFQSKPTSTESKDSSEKITAISQPAAFQPKPPLKESGSTGSSTTTLSRPRKRTSIIKVKVMKSEDETDDKPIKEYIAVSEHSTDPIEVEAEVKGPYIAQDEIIPQEPAQREVEVPANGMAQEALRPTGPAEMAMRSQAAMKARQAAGGATPATMAQQSMAARQRQAASANSAQQKAVAESRRKAEEEEKRRLEEEIKIIEKMLAEKLKLEEEIKLIEAQLALTKKN